MAAYDPKRPRPAEMSDAPAPVDALLEPTSPPSSPIEEPTGSVVPSMAESLAERPPMVNRTPAAADPGRSTEVPVAPAPRVGTANRAVLYASAGVGAFVVALLVILRVRSRRLRGAGD
jgi:hypothetical protein